MESLEPEVVDAESSELALLPPAQQALRRFFDVTISVVQKSMLPLGVGFGCAVVGYIVWYLLACSYADVKHAPPKYTPPPLPTESTVPEFLRFIQHDINVERVMWLLPYVIFASILAVAVASLAIYHMRRREIWCEDTQLVMQGSDAVMLGLRWTAIKEIQQTQSYDIFTGRNDVLIIETQQGNTFKLRMSDVLHRQDAATFFNKVRTNAPHAKLKVDASLKNDANSYTELWLKYFSVPTERTNSGLLKPGMTVKDGRYQILEIIGGGGQGTAYLARVLQADGTALEQVVLKEYVLPIHRGQLTAEKTAAKLKSEAAVLRQLDHPQIVKLVDEFVEDFRGYLVMEYVKGETLKSLVTRLGPRTEAEVVEWAIQLCAILTFMHEQSPPIVHRDLTPDNLILQENGLIKIVDFNVAHQVDSSETATVVGKHAYIPPEQFRGRPCAQSDIYALGGTMFYLLTAQEPEPITVARPRDVNDKVSRRLDKIVSRATALAADERYPSARKMLLALVQLV
ncbi:MAG: serine/threonine-protein kinase [Candidatus Obscuribacterales bacterium]|nr:serine/threonine-protein kinase [Candidatus Obscuribacterales bacterium]